MAKNCLPFHIYATIINTTLSDTNLIKTSKPTSYTRFDRAYIHHSLIQFQLKITMGLFDKFFKRKQKAKNTPVPPKESNNSLPKHVTLIENRLSVVIFKHKVEINPQQPIDCLGYRTEGFAAFGQQEFILILKDDQLKDGDVYEAPLHFFANIFQLAQQGQIVYNGGRTQFGQRNFLGASAVLYAKNPISTDPNLPADALVMLLLNNDEASVFPQFGALRLLSMFGLFTRTFPYPYWNDLQRTSLPIQQHSDSILLKVGTLSIKDAYVHLDQKRIKLIVEHDANLMLPDEGIPTNQPVAILPSLSPKADFCFTLITQEKGVRGVIGSFGESEDRDVDPKDVGDAVFAGCFLLIVANQPTNEIKDIEDGFALMVTDSTWLSFWEALKNKQLLDITSDGTPTRSFSLRFTS